MTQQLIYIWIGNYRCFQRQGFNLSSKWLCSFNDNTSTLSILLNDEHIPDFLPKQVLDVIAVIGENGSGKSSLLDLIKINDDRFLRLYQGVDLEKFDGDFIVLFAEGDNRFVAYTTLDLQERENLIVEKVASLEPVFLERSIETKSAIEPFYIYYSSVYDGRRESSHTGMFNISTGYLLGGARGELRDEGERYEYYGANMKEKYERVEVSKQITFLKVWGDLMPFKRPDSLLTNFHYPEASDLSRYERKEDYYKICKHLFLKNDEYLKELMDRWYNPNRLKGPGPHQRDLNEQEEEGRAYVMGAMLGSFVRNISIFRSSELGNDSSFGKAISAFVFDDTISPPENILRFFRQLDSPIIALAECLHLNGLSSMRRELYVRESGIDYLFELNEKYIEWFQPRIAPVGETPRAPHEFISFYWQGLSSGQVGMLSQFARFYDCEIRMRRYYPNKKHLVIMIDEGENAFHPNWQKEYFKMLMEMLPKIFNGKTMQLIIASNSPYLLSDLPTANVLMLRKAPNSISVDRQLTEMTKTFAANIHTLLSDAFFLRDGLIGAYAKKKLNEAIECLINGSTISEEHLQYLQKLISNIGEPIIRNKLKSLLDEKLESKLSERIKLLESKVAKLEKDR